MRELILASAMVLTTSSLGLAGDIDTGRQRAAQCASCHGINGRSPVPNYPNLAGQSALYLQYALKLYRDEQRTGGLAGLMHVQAAQLSDDDIANLATYYASLK